MKKILCPESCRYRNAESALCGFCLKKILREKEKAKQRSETQETEEDAEEMQDMRKEKGEIPNERK